LLNFTDVVPFPEKSNNPLYTPFLLPQSYPPHFSRLLNTPHPNCRTSSYFVENFPENHFFWHGIAALGSGAVNLP
jgi:hypothetical protein